MKFLSLCSGIDAASVASSPLGWECVGFSEIEPFPCAVLANRYPSVTNFGDMTKYAEWPEQLFIDADAIVGGPPCQAFSMAGKREGLDDARGNLTLIYANLIDHADRIRAAHGKSPVWCLYENVPGLLSDRTNAFGCLLGKLAGEDVPLLPTGGKWTNAGFVSGPARAIAWRILDAQYFGVAQRRRRVFVVASAGKTNPTEILFERENPRIDNPPEKCKTHGTILARYDDSGFNLRNSCVDIGEMRKLTPIETERLQGFPDSWTMIPWKKKPAEECPDGPRYKALGNSWAVPCAKWIFERVDAMSK